MTTHTHHMQRAQLLLEHDRPDMAENELRQWLADVPNDPAGHALLGLCLCEQQRYREATEAASQAITLGPDMPYAHFAMANIYYTRNMYKRAGQAIDQAIALDPEDADFHGLRAGIHFNNSRWDQALESAERGLAADAEHVLCTNMRAMSLVKLGRGTEAGQTIDSALARDPEDTLSHANLGWTLLHQGRHEQAMGHFREALRLDPNMDWAREGIVEALKARYWMYRQVMRYFFWMSSLSGRSQWIVIIGAYLLFRMARSAAQSHPEWGPVLWPIIGLYLLFVVLTWTAGPLFNLLLRLNKFGRLALGADDIAASNWVGGLLLVALVAGGATLLTGHVALAVGGALTAMLIIPVSTVFRCNAGWPRRTMSLYSIALGGAIVGGATCWLLAPDDHSTLHGLGILLLGAAFLGTIASSWIANIAAASRPTRN